jgi:hypothetical protein
LIVSAGLGCVACGSSDDSRQAASALGCEQGEALQGGTYDVAKSRFAWGSVPVQEQDPTFMRWVGVDGVVAINANGAELGILNAGAPEANLPDFSNDVAASQTHVGDYFASMSVQACQTSSSDVDAGSGGRVIALARSIDGIPVAESNAFARFNDANQTTSEGFYWPTIPAETVDAAEALSVRDADPAGLASYQALLPAEAQGTGRVVIHHTSSSSTAAFRSAATYDVQESGGSLGAGPTVSFDVQGVPVASDW